MKNQDDEFILKRDKVRSFIQVKRLDITSQTYRKILGLKVNGVANRPLLLSERDRLSDAIDEVIDTLNDFKNELHR
jgi:hypothetical protein